MQCTVFRLQEQPAGKFKQNSLTNVYFLLFRIVLELFKRGVRESYTAG